MCLPLYHLSGADCREMKLAKYYVTQVVETEYEYIRLREGVKFPIKYFVILSYETEVPLTVKMYMCADSITFSDFRHLIHLKETSENTKKAELFPMM